MGLVPELVGSVDLGGPAVQPALHVVVEHPGLARKGGELARETFLEARGPVRRMLVPAVGPVRRSRTGGKRHDARLRRGSPCRLGTRRGRRGGAFLEIDIEDQIAPATVVELEELGGAVAARQGNREGCGRELEARGRDGLAVERDGHLRVVGVVAVQGQRSVVDPDRSRGERDQDEPARPRLEREPGGVQRELGPIDADPAHLQGVGPHVRDHQRVGA